MSEHGKRTREGRMQTLRQNIHRFEPLLEMSGTFRLQDAELPNRHQGLSTFLKKNDAIMVVDKEYDGDNGSYINHYRWNEKTKDKLQAYVNRLNRFSDNTENGCNHRVHISHHPNKDCLTCRYCDDNPEYPKDKVGEWL